MPRQPWTPEQKAEALALMAQVGKAEASRRTGIPTGTIGAWANRAGVTNADPEGRAAYTAAANMAWAERRAILADMLGETAQKAAERLLVLLDDPEAKIDQVARALAVVVDRASLLAGEATQRVENVATDAAPRTPEVEAEVAKVLSIVRAA